MMEYIEVTNNVTGMRGTTKLYETAEEAAMSALPVGEFFEHVVEYDGGYAVISRQPDVGGRTNGASAFYPTDRSKQGATLNTSRLRAESGLTL